MYPNHHPRGSAFITTLWVITALAALVLTLAGTMRVETQASANRMAAAQAEAALRGAEQFVLAAVQAEVATPGALADVSMENITIGTAQVWIIKPDVEDAGTLAYGLSDECGKLNINFATPEMLAGLPDITQDVVDSIVDWRDPDSTPGAEGAEDPYYLALAEPYHCKNGNFETPEELLLVKGVTLDLLYGADRTREGWLDDNELDRATSSTSTLTVGNTSPRGIMPYLTVYRPTATTSSTSGVADVNGNNSNPLRQALSPTLGSTRTEEIVNLTRLGRPYNSVFDWAARVNLSSAEFAKVSSKVTANFPGSQAIAKLNINTAAKQTLMCLPGCDESDASAIINRRDANTANPGDIFWLLDVLSKDKISKVGAWVTGTSSIYSADIVAVSDAGRAFKRSHIVVNGGVTPARIIYHRDMTVHGWPLPDTIRAALRLGTTVSTSSTPSGVLAP